MALATLQRQPKTLGMNILFLVTVYWSIEGEGSDKRQLLHHEYKIEQSPIYPPPDLIYQI
eukprot:scaffold9405_cov111-Cylindrotheca_fusiformis.AAC.4